MFRTFLSEWKGFFRNKKHIIFISAIALIPIIYSGMFLWAFWSPYDRTEHLPVAIVNEDGGATLAGKEVNIGNDLVKELKKNDSFDWHFVSQKKADQEMKDNQYYMTITIPKDFSKDATTVLDHKTVQPKFEYRLNSGYNYIASQITDNGAKEIKEKLNHQLTKTYTDNMFSEIDQLAAGLKTASKGAGKLSSGTQEELEGLNTLKSHLTELNDAGIQLEDGAAQLASGSSDLENGLVQSESGTQKLYETTKNNTSKVNALAEGTQTLAGKTQALNNGIQQLVKGNQTMIGQLKGQKLADGLDELSKGMQAEYKNLAALNQATLPLKDIQTQLDNMNRYITGSQKIFSTIEDFSTKNKQDLTPEQQKELDGILEGIKQLNSGSNSEANPATLLASLSKFPDAIQQLTDGQKQLLDGFNELNANLQQLSSGLTVLQQNINKLPNATTQLADGAEQLAEGSQQLNQQWGTLVASMGQLNSAQEQLVKGSQSLNKNMEKLQAGLTTLNSGQNQLTDGASDLSKGMKTIHKGSGELADNLGDAAKQTDNANLGDQNANMFSEPLKAEKSSGGVDKYGVGFTPYFLSLGLFVGALLLTVIYDVVTPAIRPKNGVSWALGKYMFIGVVGIVQALIADAIIFFAIGLRVSDPGVFIAFSVLTSLVFMTIIQFFTTLLGEPGRFLVILILVLQLTTTGGTYPIELLPSALYDFHHWLPMNYSIAGFRNIVAGGQQGLLWHHAFVLACFGVFLLAGTVVTLTLRHKRQVKRDRTDDASISA
ncbi:putative membrane protein [Pullulanibacillus pueri]|uniref:ABC-2 type transporter transmembrane domain-containing protein n=1 Tax=Pullulanibacillus pueri TaxID=1437324 RepID=A0A8J3EKN6_9BACL|nr:YhgE/Pip domain-containing protein [Pullulanibacillus pueri]MBM7680392.1 putative membrane protein [Pullulanibacillus pueri]GGH75297.1 hypothetical protein GCM10007096_04380 [Pullulanibacillus pueri]